MKATKKHAARRLWKPRAEQTFQDILGQELVFPDLIAGEDPAVGDTVYLDGQFATGTFLMPGAETIIAEDGEVIEVLEPTEETVGYAKRVMNKRKNNKKRKL
ncbi:hypothetical protein [Flagellimonas eckloniae]|uniref:Uncharacterized protein n=1 Tax=Flagellimonas eckloniae TaxID=346185 RepID=A0A0Q1CK90_9FLAO|nr:hypothetical protein [Allomuricauda eckloniae]KQC31434.1 hypothetical protein AAY42_17310 [Allomuricauda eckloniae]